MNPSTENSEPREMNWADYIDSLSGSKRKAAASPARRADAHAADRSQPAADRDPQDAPAP